MTLADDDSNSILADDANRAIGQFGVDGCHLDFFLNMYLINLKQ